VIVDKPVEWQSWADMLRAALVVHRMYEPR
jgi:hypothetical protein